MTRWNKFVYKIQKNGLLNKNFDISLAWETNSDCFMKNKS